MEDDSGDDSQAQETNDEEESILNKPITDEFFNELCSTTNLVIIKDFLIIICIFYNLHICVQYIYCRRSKNYKGTNNTIWPMRCKN